MKMRLILFVFIILLISGCNTSKEKAMSGNPILEGWYADPEGTIFDDTYWIYPTFSDYTEEYVPIPDSLLTERQKLAPNKSYLKQRHFDAFSSKDLVNWTKHPNILTIDDVEWVEYAMWAPAIVRKDGKYFFYFSANDIKNNDELGGIGVAISDKPEGPFKDALGRPLIDKIQNGAQPIDQFVFKDKDGQYYMYYGGWRHCNIVKMGDDLTSIIPFEDGEMFKEITPEGYVEGPFVFIRNGKYYFMWSEGDWGTANYRVAYSIADSPMGPFKRIGTILQQDANIATGAGHNSVINIPGTDDWYIIYHRKPLGDTNSNHRHTCIDKMEFNEDGTIKPIQMTFEGVESRLLK